MWNGNRYGQKPTPLLYIIDPLDKHRIENVNSKVPPPPPPPPEK